MKINGFLIFLGGLIVGGAGGFFGGKAFAEKKIRKELEERYSQMETENEELKDYCRRMRMVENMKNEAEKDGYISRDSTANDVSNAAELKKRSEINRAGKIDYTRFYEANEQVMQAMAEAESPREDDEYGGESSHVGEDFDIPDSYYETRARREEDVAHDISREMNEGKQKPKLIKREDWFEDGRFDKVTLNYYMNDEILATEDNEIIPDQEALLGDCLDKYGFKTNDEIVIYIRNMRRGTDYEVAKVFQSFEDFE